jgi:exosortase
MAMALGSAGSDPARRSSGSRDFRIASAAVARRAALCGARAGNWLRQPLTLIGLQVVCLWPIWQWYGRRLIEGSDETWGLLALGAAGALLREQRGTFRLEPRPILLLGAGMLTLLSALTSPWLHLLARGVLGLSALGLLLAAVLGRPRSLLPLGGLLFLSLPVLSSTQLQLYLGYPLRAFTAWASKGVLAIAGLQVAQTGTALTWMGRTVLVDAPCSGIRMLWVGLLLAAMLSYFGHASPGRYLLNAVATLLIILAGNVLRNSLLFVKEAGILRLPAWTHEGIGLMAFLLTSLLIVGFTRWRSHACEGALCGNGLDRCADPGADPGGAPSLTPVAGSP